MFAKFKKWVNLNRQKQRREEIAQTIELKNAIINISDCDYFVARAQVTDVPEIIEVERKIYGNTPWNEAAFLQEIRRRRDRLYLVVRKNDKLLGFAGCSFNRQTNEAHLTNIAISAEYQGKGGGGYLIHKLIRKAALINMKKMTLEVRSSNCEAQRLYRRIGFIVVGKKVGYYFGDHEDALDMELDLEYLKGN